MVWVRKVDELVCVLWHDAPLSYAICNPIIREDFASKVMLHTRQLLLLILPVAIVKVPFFWNQTQHYRETLNDVCNLATMRQNLIQALLRRPLRHVENKRDHPEEWQTLLQQR